MAKVDPNGEGFHMWVRRKEGINIDGRKLNVMMHEDTNTSATTSTRPITTEYGIVWK